MKRTSRFSSLHSYRYAIGSLAVLALTALHPLDLAHAQTLADALDAPQLTWTTGGNQPWVGQTTVRHDGVDAARSGAIGNDQQSWLQTTVTGPGTLSFWWKVSSEVYADILEFQVNGSSQPLEIFGEVDWRREFIELEAGSQTLRWRYYKDFSVAEGQDRGWVDTVRFIPADGPPVILNDPLSQTAEEGTSVTFEVGARGATPFSYQWYRGLTLLSGAEDAALTLLNLSAADAGQYTVRVQNSLNSVTSAPALLTVIPASLDSAFDPATDGSITALAVQPDGKILVGGNFTSLGGQPRANLGRLNPDGSLDLLFNPGANGGVGSLVIQPDGKVLVVGSFSTLAGTTRSGIGRLNADSSIDTAFAPVLDGTADILVLQADGKILIAGGFTTVGGQPRINLARLNANGTLDTTFRRDIDGFVACLALQANGSILVGGSFSLDVAGDIYFNMVRLGSSGAVDGNFYPDPDGSIDCIAVQPDGRILVSGGFSVLDSGNSAFSCAGLGRIDGSGNPDTSFNPAPAGQVTSIMLQADGKIVVGGNFTSLAGQLRDGLGRLNANGTIDNTFVPSADGPVESLAMQSDGRILVGGSYTALGGQPRDGLGRLNPTTTPTQSLTYAGTTITWLRGGTSPETWRTTFEHSADGNTWTVLGAGSRVTGGWQRTGASVPAGNTIRARGYVVGGNLNSSGSIVEAVRGKPAIVTHPMSRTNDFGTTATFSVVANVVEPLSYQWLKNGVPLSNQGNISGAKTNRLTLSAVSKADEGGFRVVVTNSFGSVTSLVATLTVRDPYITQQPLSLERNLGQSATFSVAAAGTSPFAYQWYRDGVAIGGAATPEFSLQDLTVNDAAYYTVVITNPQGSITSAPALLTVNAANLESAFAPAADGLVGAIAIQPDGKILLAGAFTYIDGQYRNRLARLNPDGTMDNGFDPAVAGEVFCLAVQPNGKILIGGQFSAAGGQSRSRLARLNPDGTIDDLFYPGANGDVYSLVVQVDGKILVGGAFTTLAGQSRNHLGRLNADGSLDTTFNPTADGDVLVLALQTDGKILVGGFFSTLAGQPRELIGRLNANGIIDAAFNPGADYGVKSLAVQADGKILVGGDFVTLAGQPRNFLGRLHPDGALDSTFNPDPDWLVFSLALQTDGDILVGGAFTNLTGRARSHVARLKRDGTLDGTFNPRMDGPVYALAVQPDGKVLAGGEFTLVGDQPRNNLARLNNTGTATQSLEHVGNTITWLRGGTGPELWRSTFETSTDGLNWSSLGEGTRTAGGWQKTGVVLSANATLRARGNVAGDQFGSAWFVEYIVGPSLPIQLSFVQNGGSVELNWSGGPGPFQLQQAINLDPPIPWQDVGGPVLGNSISLPVGTDSRFWRIRRP